MGIASLARPMRPTFAFLSVFATLLLAHAQAAPVAGECSPSAPAALTGVGASVRAAQARTEPPVGTIRFDVRDGRWEETRETNGSRSGRLFQGAPIELISAPTRFPRCGNERVTAYVRTDDGVVHALPMGGYDAASNRYSAWFLPPTGARSIDVWFKSEKTRSNRWGSALETCTEWDSDFGGNYHFDLTPYEPSVAIFPADAAAGPVLDKPLAAGGALALDYDPARLTGCRSSHRGYPTWQITAHARFDDGTEKRAVVVENGRPSTRFPVIAIPEGATSAEVWFENLGLYPGDRPVSCRAFDSKYGANYRFEIR